jgi:hypothetical protein
MMYRKTLGLTAIIAAASLMAACQDQSATTEVAPAAGEMVAAEETKRFLNQPLISHIYTADPSAQIFDGKIYLYPSHDEDTGITTTGDGDRFDMRDYHVFSMDKPGGPVTDHGVALSLGDVPWAGRQLWAPDAAEKNGKYFLYFPAKDKQDIFRIGVATGTSPAGPFMAEPEPIPGSFSVDPAVFKDTDGEYYLYVGGIWGGQLQRWSSGNYLAEDQYPADDQPALAPKVARMSDDMLTFAEELRDVQILDQDGTPILTGDNDRRFFEAAWVHKYNGKYYFSYSTGDTHYIVYATGDSPYGPFTYQGVILEPVLGWTNHHSIVEFEGKWYLFYHDTEVSEGQTHLRNVKMTELTHKADGSIQTINPFVK